MDPARLRGVFSRAAVPAVQTREGNGIWAAESTEQVEGAMCRGSGCLGFLCVCVCVAFRMGRGSLCVFSLSKNKTKQNKKQKNITSEKFWKMYGKNLVQT